MTRSEGFDKVLRTRDKDAIFKWAMDQLIWDPNSLEARAMVAYAFMVNGQTYDARDEAERVLSEDPDQAWALAVLSVTQRVELVEKNPTFFEEGIFKLGPEWIERLDLLENKRCAKMMIYLQARFGAARCKSELSERFTVPNRVQISGEDEESAGDPFCAVGK